MKTLLFTISLAFSLVASAQVPQTALNCADDTEGVNATEIRTDSGTNGTPWNHSVNKDKAYYNGALYTGIVKVCGKNTGKVISKLSFKNGIKDGLSYKYHKEGWLQWKKNYANGKEEGHQNYFYPSDVMAINNNTPGKNAGVNLNRRIKESYWAKNGIKDGKARAYYANGDMKYLKIYDYGKMQGDQLYYYANGDMKYHEIYDNGKKHGDQLYYYEDSILERKEYYINGVMDGIQLYYNKNGTLAKEEIPRKSDTPSWVKSYDEKGVLIDYEYFDRIGRFEYGYKLIRGTVQYLDPNTYQLKDKDMALYVYSSVYYIEYLSDLASRSCSKEWRVPNKTELSFLYKYRAELPIKCENYCNDYSCRCAYKSSVKWDKEKDRKKEQKEKGDYWIKCFIDGDWKLQYEIKNYNGTKSLQEVIILPVSDL